MPDQIINPLIARGLHTDTCRTHPMVGWIVLQDPPEYPDKFVARLVTQGPTPYVLRADSLAEVQSMLPSGLVRSPRQPADPPDVVEVWFST